MDIVQERVGLARVVERQNVGVLQVGGDFDFLEEPLGADDRGQLGAQNLESDLAAVLEVEGEVDGRHAALAELPLEAIATTKGGRQP
ncbi:MAG TPA: hypothetical protein VGQ69_14535 [Gemmatimonadales bacterium]|jgi:hypothetical protein|nr:hypothetical protein [Gemmatimonadales bacterium]